MSQSNLERTPLPSLPGSADTVLKKSVAGPNGTVYSLLAGETVDQVQILRVVKQAPGQAPVEFPLINTAAEGSGTRTAADLVVDAAGSAYVLYTSGEAPDQGLDARVVRFGAAGDFRWSKAINDFWRDDDWVLHPFVDQGVSMAYDASTNAFYVLSTRSATDKSQKFALLTRMSNTGVTSWTQSYLRNNNGNDVNPVKVVVAGNKNPVALMNTEDATGQDISTVGFNATSGFVAWQEHFADMKSVYDAGTDIARGSDNSIFVVGVSGFEDTRSGVPYPYTGEVVLKYGENGGLIGNRTFIENDRWDRKGQVGPPSVAADGNGGAYVAGSSNAYDDPQPPLLISVRYYDAVLNQPFARYMGPTGNATGVGTDGYGNAYVTGYRTSVNSNGVTANRAFALKVSHSLNITTGMQELRQMWLRVDPAGAADAALSEPPYGVSVLPVTAGDPSFGITEKVKVSGIYRSTAAMLKSLDDPEVVKFELDRSTVFGKFKREATVTLNRPVSSVLYPDGMTFTINSNSTAVLSKTFKVMGGQKVARVLLDTNSVETNTTATLRISPTFLFSANLAVLPFSVTLTTDKAQYDGGDTFDIKVTLSEAAPPEGIAIQLKSNNAALPLPLNGVVTFSAGETVKIVTVQSKAVYADTSVTVQGPPSFTSSVTVTLKPIATTITSSRRTMLSFESGRVIATLAKPAPKGGYIVALKSSDPTILPLPKAIKVAEGYDRASTAFTVAEVSQRTDITISGGPGLASSTVVTIQPQYVKSIVLETSSVLGGTKQIKGTVTLSGGAPSAGAQITLTSSTPSIVVPATVTIAAGGITADFYFDTNPVSAEVTGYIRATFNATVSASLVVNPVKLNSFTVDPQVVGGSRLNGSLTLDAPAPSGGMVVQVTSDRAAVDSPTLTVPAGQSSLTFSIATLPVDVDTIATLTAQAGSVKLTASTTVKAPVIESIVADPSTLNSGAMGKLTVNLASPAPSGGIVVSLSSNSAALSVPSSVMIPGGAKSGTVTVKANTVTTSTTVTAKATLGGSVKTTTVTVNP